VTDDLVRVKGLVKTFERRGGAKVRAINDISFTVPRGKFVVLLGPSGCGKTTLLRSIAGLERPDSGMIEVAGQVVFSRESGTWVPTERRGLSMIFQSYALWPHMTVAQNVGYPLRVKRMKRRDIDEKVKHVLEVVGIADIAHQYPSHISGGQQQRAALARAIVPGNSLVLFDEPLSNVDAKVREQLRWEILELQSALQLTAIYVTHDQAEAMELATTIIVLRDGQIAQEGPPKAVYSRPNSKYVANFVGTTTELPGVVRRNSGIELLIDTALGPVSAAADGNGSLMEGQSVTVMSRPEAWCIDLVMPNRRNQWLGTIGRSQFLGSHTILAVSVGVSIVRVWYLGHEEFVEGQEVWISIDQDALMVLD
jgi:iron(III) transport system ATP-binding protein